MGYKMRMNYAKKSNKEKDKKKLEKMENSNLKVNFGFIKKKKVKENKENKYE